MSDPQPGTQSFSPTALQGTAESLTVTWNDGREDCLPWKLLRDACPCATCRDERTKPAPQPELLPVLSPAEAAPLRVQAMHPVGNYAYGIHFSDGHNSGIYTFELLRALGDALIEQRHS
ncbi:MAG: DUF971 domain-containing protein [Planctomycetaceae bacterium]